MQIFMELRSYILFAQCFSVGVRNKNRKHAIDKITGSESCGLNTSKIVESFVEVKVSSFHNLGFPFHKGSLYFNGWF